MSGQTRLKGEVGGPWWTVRLWAACVLAARVAGKRLGPCVSVPHSGNEQIELKERDTPRTERRNAMLISRPSKSRSRRACASCSALLGPRTNEEWEHSVPPAVGMRVSLVLRGIQTLVLWAEIKKHAAAGPTQQRAKRRTAKEKRKAGKMRSAAEEQEDSRPNSKKHRVS